eukprot:TRINITY_DN4595_c0_g1_i19.p1 TRINITY_DN4595_c0_g1~~TRINITY_DN4595_c0_g1_i19.p1  ORF type:complete len:264 (-),score=46.74 TRINITY_DN4595_c0_g1_i19:696-1487(-)
MIQELFNNATIGIEISVITLGGAKLAQQVTNPKVKELLNGNFDYVILQEQSCIPGGANPGLLEESIRILEDFYVPNILAGQNKSVVPIFYATFGHSNGVIPPYRNLYPFDQYPDYLTMQTKVTNGYKNIYLPLFKTYFSRVLLCPVGDAFEIVYRDSHGPGSEFFKFPNLFRRMFDSRDTFHPSKIGTYLAACCFFGVISGKSPKSLNWIPDSRATAEWDKILSKRYGTQEYIPETVNEEVGEYLRDVADRALAGYMFISSKL